MKLYLLVRRIESSLYKAIYTSEDYTLVRLGMKEGDKLYSIEAVAMEEKFELEADKEDEGVPI